MTQSDSSWTLDPDDPRAPSREVWDRMTPEQRAHVVASLPTEFPVRESCPPAGDRHVNAWTGARQTLRRWFHKRGKRIYIGGNLPVYYPGETMFSPDVLAVLDTDPRDRESWIVSDESGRGLDLALEVVVSGRRRKDVVDNPLRYARLGIREYFVFDVNARKLAGYRLAQPGEAYQRLLPQVDFFHSDVFDLDLSVESGRLRFSVSGALVPDIEELVSKLELLVDDAQARQDQLEAQNLELQLALEAEQRRRVEEELRSAEEQRRRVEEELRSAEEQRRRVEEQRRRERAEAEIAALRAEIERLERGR